MPLCAFLFQRLGIALVYLLVNSSRVTPSIQSQSGCVLKALLLWSPCLYASLRVDLNLRTWHGLGRFSRPFKFSRCLLSPLVPTSLLTTHHNHGIWEISDFIKALHFGVILDVLGEHYYRPLMLSSVPALVRRVKAELLERTDALQCRRVTL